jgi:hypothetical protein
VFVLRCILRDEERAEYASEKCTEPLQETVAEVHEAAFRHGVLQPDTVLCGIGRVLSM